MTRTLEARRVRGIQWGVTLALLVVVLRVTPLTRGFFLFPLIENFAYDTLFDNPLARPEPPSDIVIVAIDDPTLRALGRFQSWHRDAYARLLERLQAAKLVAFDILFAESDEQDAAFAEAIRRHGRVVLAAHWSLQTPDNAPGKWTQQFGYPRSTGRLAEGKVGETIVFPSHTLQPWNAAAVGYVDLYPDADGAFRRFQPLVRGPQGLSYPHFATAIAAVAAGKQGEEIARESGQNRLNLNVSGLGPLPLDDAGSALINYCGPLGTVPTVSFVDVLRDPRIQAQLAGKIVIVGATAPGLYDLRPSVYRSRNRLFYGVETNANIVNTLLHRKPLRDMSGSWGWALLALLLGLTVSLLVWNTGEAVAATLSLAILFLLAAPSFFVAFLLLHQWIPYAAVLLAVAVPLAVALPERLTMDKRLVQRQFSAYVSPEVLRELMADPEVLRAPTRREVTLLFADVRDSTALAESISPEVWVAQLNEYLTQMSLAIFAFDGYLDKFMGDGLMAVWNAFGNHPDDHAELAVRAGLQMLRRLELLNKKWAQMPDRRPLRIGIGLHTGQPVVGNVGSEERTQFTAIGDAVNTAARIETMCKQLGVEFIISEETARYVRNLFTLRELGEAEVRGRAAGIRIFEVPRDAAAVAPGSEAEDALRQEKANQGQD